jgi:hypothetical protein
MSVVPSAHCIPADAEPAGRSIPEREPARSDGPAAHASYEAILNRLSLTCSFPESHIDPLLPAGSRLLKVLQHVTINPQ